MAVRKTDKGAALKRWFKEDWKDVSTGKACGRKKGDGRSTPYCRPSKRVSNKTPKTSGEMTAAQKKSRIAQKKSLGQPAGKPRRVASLTRRNTVKKMKEGGMLKAVPEDKKKSLGKLPTPVRKKMGFMREGGTIPRAQRQTAPTSRAQMQRAAPTSSRAQGQNPRRLSKEEMLKRRTEARREINKKNTMPRPERRYPGRPAKVGSDAKRKDTRGRAMKEGGEVIVDRQYLKGK